MAWQPREKPNRLARKRQATQAKMMNLAPKAIKAIRDILEGTDPKHAGHRLRAAMVVIERVLGRVPYEVTGADGGPVEIHSAGEDLRSVLGLVVAEAAKAKVPSGLN